MHWASGLRRAGLLAALIALLAAACEPDRLDLLPNLATSGSSSGSAGGGTAGGGTAGASAAQSGAGEPGGAMTGGQDNGDAGGAPGFGGFGGCPWPGCGGGFPTGGSGVGIACGEGGFAGADPCERYGLHCSSVLGCVRCTGFEHCPPGEICYQSLGVCSGICPALDCQRDGRVCDPHLQACVDCEDDFDCAANTNGFLQACLGGRCKECRVNNDCEGRGDRTACSFEHRCVQCNVDQDCDNETFHCKNGRCER
jgi:hypothetical protein